MVAALGGPRDLLERPDRYLARAPVVQDIAAAEEGIVAAIDTRALGLAVVALGGGRVRVEDRIDPAVGLDSARRHRRCGRPGSSARPRPRPRRGGRRGGGRNRAPGLPHRRAGPSAASGGTRADRRLAGTRVGSSTKTYRYGTHRAFAPEQTIARVRPMRDVRGHAGRQPHGPRSHRHPRRHGLPAECEIERRLPRQGPRPGGGEGVGNHGGDRDLARRARGPAAAAGSLSRASANLRCRDAPATSRWPPTVVSTTTCRCSGSRVTI